MALLGELGESVFGGTPLGVGIAAVAVGAVVLGPRAKPLLKKAIIGYLAASERVRELVAEASEQLQDIYAEARYEFEAGLRGEASADGKPAAEPA
ncbi:MAG TPA: hypothetical protein VKZ60_01770 [Chloroflexota bacterium]|jgi:hypothetical protein|nr:hypothetical protein [Chloroflexota bacterium]